MATITQENAKQIRDPMRVSIRFEAGGTTTITAYNPTANKSYDATLGDTAMSMRKIADLQDGGFPLDGTHEWYEDKNPSDENGKLGLRSIAGHPVTVTLTASSRLDSITIESTGVDYIEKGGTRYPSTGLDVIPIMANSATLTFYPDDPNGRVFIKYIVPGAIFNITNDNLISCNVALRSNLSADNPTWEESDMEVQFYYPYDISETLAYIQDDWPLTYQAGYSDEMSELRKFYLSEPGIQQGNIVTLHAVDASSLMDEKTVGGRVLNNGEFTVSAYELGQFVRSWIETSGITIEKANNAGNRTASAETFPVIQEMAARDAVILFMNLTATLPEDYRISFVDAGIPTFQVGETFTKVWEIDEEDIAELVIETPRHINRVVNTSEDYRFDQQITYGKTQLQTVNAEKEQIYSLDFNSLTLDASLKQIPANPLYYPRWARIITLTPWRAVWRITENAETYEIRTQPLLLTGGADQYTDSSGLPGVPIEMEPPIYGQIKIGNILMLSPKNLLNRPNKTISFKFKGDPRMQPRDFLQINRLDGSRFRTRLTSIETTHEGGGTMATVTAQLTNLWKE